MNRLTLVLVAIILALCWIANHYHDKAVGWRKDYHAVYQASQQRASVINDMQARQQSLAALDAKRTKELADAQNQIDALERDIAAGRKQLQLHARCPSVPADKSSGTSGMDDGAGPRLTGAAERNYYTLRILMRGIAPGR